MADLTLSRRTRGILCILLAALGFSGMSACARLAGPDIPTVQKAFFRNFVALLAAIALTRSQGVYDEGVFSIAYAVAALMLYVGQYGFRKFQSSDIRDKYSFAEYYGIRIITCVVMMLAALVVVSRDMLGKMRRNRAALAVKGGETA